MSDQAGRLMHYSGQITKSNAGAIVKHCVESEDVLACNEQHSTIKYSENMKRATLLIICVLVGGNLFPQWLQVGQGANADVHDLIVYDNKLVAGGAFNNIGGGISQWDGSIWAPIGQGVDSGGRVFCLDTFNADLYAAGDFSMMDGIPANNIAVWNGSNWSAIPGGTNGTIVCMTFYGGELYVGGQFTMAGTIPANNIAKWDGANWVALGNGLDGGFSHVHSLCVYNNELYAGGVFASQGNNIAKWNGTTWSPLGAGTDDQVNSLLVFNNDLYVGGTFHNVNSSPCDLLAKWNGAWSSVVPNVDFAVFTMNNINGNLFIAGGGPPSNSFAEWDGTTWTPIATGIPSPQMAFLAHGILAIEKYGNDIYLGGQFFQAWSEPGDCIIYTDQSVGSDEIVTQGKTLVNPNPATVHATIYLPRSGEKKTVIVFDNFGKEIWRKETPEHEVNFSVEGMAPGLYFYAIEENCRRVAQGKFAVQ